MAETGFVLDIDKALKGRFVDEGLFGGKKPLRRISVLLPISKEEGFNCHKAVIDLSPLEGGLYRIEKVQRFRALCICCGSDRAEEVAVMDEAAETRLREYLKDAAG